jgi:hypothetical protein
MSIIDNAKELTTLIQKIGDIELYRKIVNLEQEIFELTRAKLSTEDELEKTKRLLAFKGALHFKPPVYFADGDKIPFCPTCWERDSKAIHLGGPYRDSQGTCYRCQVCEGYFDTEGSSIPPGDDFS